MRDNRTPLGHLGIPKISLEPLTFFHDFQSRTYVQYAELIEKTDIGKSILQTMSEDSRITTFEGKMLSRGNGGDRFEIKVLAMWFLWIANEYGLERAKQHLETFLITEEIPVINTLWVLGIEVDQTIPLMNGISFEPIQSLPDSRDKEYFLQMSFGSTSFFQPKPKCAITKTCKIQKFYELDPATKNNSDSEYTKSGQQLYDIAVLANALNGITCIPYYSTSYVDHSMPYGPFWGTGGQTPIYDVTTHSTSKLHANTIDTIIALLTKYETLSTLERARLTRVLQRLSQAKRRMQIEDKILDLGVALEMLLLDDNQNHDQLSLSFRLRGAWLLGKSPEDRLKKYQQFRDIYNYRSQVAHTGILCKGDFTKMRRVQELFPEYQTLAEEICQKIILHGSPDWNKLTLGF